MVLALLVGGAGLARPPSAGAQPAHDECVDAREVPSLPFVDVLNTAAATADPSDPKLCGFGGGPTVWYRYRPEQDTTVCLMTSASDYDTVVAPFTDRCDNLPFSACYIQPSPHGSDPNADSEMLLAGRRTVRFLIAARNRGDGGMLRLRLAEDGKDQDRDRIPDCADNCVLTPNRLQEDANRDGVGDACDGDGDGAPVGADNCPQNSNPDQLDSDFDGVGDACDMCDGPDVTDVDADTIPDGCDNCVLRPNVDQTDADGDGIGNACECGDASGDGLINTTDVRFAQRCAVGQGPCVPLCDVTGDGICNTTDARLLQRVIVGQLTKESLRCSARP